MNNGRTMAVAQTCPVRGDVHANTEEHLRLIACAAAEGATVVLFPELSLTGYEIELARVLAFTDADPRLTPLRDAARQAAVHAVVGAPVLVDGRLHIGAFVLRPDGSTGLYTKRRLGAFSASAARDGVVPPAEATAFEPGSHDAPVPFGDGAAALAVCADIGDPAHVRRAADAGAAAYLASMFVIPSEFDGDEQRLTRYATEHGLVIAMANYGAATGGLAAAGRSSIWSGAGELLVRLDAAGSGVAIAAEHDGAWRTRSIRLS